MWRLASFHSIFLLLLFILHLFLPLLLLQPKLLIYDGTSDLQPLCERHYQRTVQLPIVMFGPYNLELVSTKKFHSLKSLLYRLSDRGKTVIMSIHQPRYLIFKLFDTLTLLSKGNIVYHGASQKCLQYFENLGRF